MTNCNRLAQLAIDPKSCFATYQQNWLNATPAEARDVLQLISALQYMVVAFAPLSCQQAGKLTHLDARLIWLYDNANDVERVIQCIVIDLRRRGRTVPTCVSVCAAWLATCAQTSFLIMERGRVYEWDFAFKSQNEFYEATKQQVL